MPTKISAGARRDTVLREIEILARVHTNTAVATLAEICRDPEQPAMARVASANALLDRGWGRPKQVVDLGPGTEHMNDEQLAAAIAERLDALGVSRDGLGRPGPSVADDRGAEPPSPVQSPQLVH